MPTSREEYRPQDMPIYQKCLLLVIQDIIVVEIREYNGDPERIPLKKGTNVMLIDGRPTFCATDKICGMGPLVKIVETKGVDIPDRFIGRTVVVPARCLKLHPNVL